MAKTIKTDAPSDAQTEPKLSLGEFCQRLSEKISRPELIGGFEFVERRAGRLKDLASAYQGRFDTFVQTPI